LSDFLQHNSKSHIKICAFLTNIGRIACIFSSKLQAPLSRDRKPYTGSVKALADLLRCNYSIFTTTCQPIPPGNSATSGRGSGVSVY
jgi:hypothetical protein